MKQHIDTITDLLLGAAYADKRLAGSELNTIETLLSKVLGVDELPAAQQRRITSFNPARFDVAAAAGELKALSELDKHKLLDLIGSVNDSDDELDFDEDAYLRKVASALGLSDDEVDHLQIEVLDDESLAGLLD